MSSDTLKWQTANNSSNNFIDHIYRLYNAVYNPTYVEYIYRKKKYVINEEFHSTLKKVNSFLNVLDYTTHLHLYDVIYSYADFIKIIEKMFLFENDSCSKIACDNKLGDNTKVLVFTTKGASIKFTAYKDHFDEIIKLHIYRNFGKHMENNYMYINGTICSDSTADDIILLDVIMDTIIHMMKSFFSYILSLIASDLIHDSVLTNIDEYTEDPYYNSGTIQILDLEKANKFIEEEDIIKKGIAKRKVFPTEESGLSLLHSTIMNMRIMNGEKK